MLAHRNSDGRVEFVSVIARDISDRRALEAELHNQARRDQLTGLPNRRTLNDRLDERLGDGREPVALVFIDLDEFKVINDSEGHEAGDRLLVAAADRLRNAVRPDDLVARFGGDEFVVLLEDIHDLDTARDLAGRLLDHVRGALRVGPVEVFLTASAGVALDDGSGPGSLIANADAAMYKAKTSGRDQVAVFSTELREATVQRLRTSQVLRDALLGDHLDVWFQPIVGSRDARPLGLEALLRWRRAGPDAVPIEELVATAEETGMVMELGALALRKTCAAIASFGDAVDGMRFSVNISAHQLADPELPDLLTSTMAEFGVRPDQLRCEITESAVMGDVSHSVDVLDRIRRLGLGISVDDFGTGYSSLAYLHELPVDALKIDRKFVSGLSTSTEWERSLAAGIVSLGHSLGLRSIAEGVETLEQREILTRLGCDAMQGYLFSPAVPADDVPELLARLRSSR